MKILRYYIGTYQNSNSYNWIYIYNEILVVEWGYKQLGPSNKKQTNKIKLQTMRLENVYFK